MKFEKFEGKKNYYAFCLAQCRPCALPSLNNSARGEGNFLYCTLTRCSSLASTSRATSCYSQHHRVHIGVHSWTFVQISWLEKQLILLYRPSKNMQLRCIKDGKSKTYLHIFYEMAGRHGTSGFVNGIVSRLAGNQFTVSSPGEWSAARVRPCFI